MRRTSGDLEVAREEVARDLEAEGLAMGKREIVASATKNCEPEHRAGFRTLND
jgi:hypothetical protein